MAEPLVPDALRALIAPLLPERPPRPKARLHIPAVQRGEGGIGGSGMTCWRRLRDWQAAGVFVSGVRARGAGPRLPKGESFMNYSTPAGSAPPFPPKP
jgi:hypothetical protein